MKLNAKIICERLSREYDVILYGSPSNELQLLPPELYMDHCDRLCADHVYLATVEHLPHRPVIERNVLLICIGDSNRLSYYKDRATVILIRKKADFFGVFKSLQSIYNQFSEWESKLLALFTRAPTIQDVLDCSYPIFKRPTFVLDEAFQYIGSIPVQTQNPSWRQSRQPLDWEDFLDFLKSQDLSMDKRGVLVLNCLSKDFLCVNLFNSHDRYIGCVYMELEENPYQEGEEKLVEYLAHMLERVVEISPVLMENENSSLAEILQITMNEMPLTQNQKLVLKAYNQKKDYICISTHYLKRFSALPVSYLCTAIGNLLPGSILFEWNNTLLGLIPIFPETAKKGTEVTLTNILQPLIQQMDLCIGISNIFSDLYLLRTYYAQAEAAIENGQLLDPHEKIYLFSRYALSEMITNSLGRFPVEAYYPEGFRKLIEHDEASELSYLDTLNAYLEENMSVASTARRLFLHRSTLIERIGRIEREMSMDLKDPDQRLQLQILLKAIQLEKQMKQA